MSDIQQANIPASTLTFLASAARTVTGAGSAIPNLSTAKTLVAQFNVTVASGTAPTLDVIIEDTVDGTNYNTIGTFTQATGVTRQVLRITSAFADTLRVSYTVAGVTPSFTFSVLTFADSQ